MVFKKCFLYLNSLIFIFFRFLHLFLNKSSNLKTLLMCKRNDFYFRNVLWNLHIIAQLRAQNLRDVPTFQPDSLAFVKKWKLPLSTVPKNYIWNQSSLIVQSLKNMHIFFRSYLSPKRAHCVLKKTMLMCPKWRKLLKGHPKLVIRNCPPAWSRYAEQRHPIL